MAGENLEAGFLVRAPLLPPALKGVWPGGMARLGRSTLTFRMKESSLSSLSPCCLILFRAASMDLMSSSEIDLTPTLLPLGPSLEPPELLGPSLEPPPPLARFILIPLVSISLRIN